MFMWLTSFLPSGNGGEGKGSDSIAMDISSYCREKNKRSGLLKG